MKTENVKPKQEFIFTQTKINKKSAAESRAAKGAKGDRGLLNMSQSVS